MGSTKKSNFKDSELLLMLQSPNPTRDLNEIFIKHFEPLLRKKVSLRKMSGRFSAFLDRSFDILSERLKEPSMFKYTDDKLIPLFNVYKTCLNAMEELLPICEQPDKHWLSLQVQYLFCLEANKLGRSVNLEGRTLLEKVEEKVDIPIDCHEWVIKIYMVLLRTAARNTSEDMKNLLDLVEQAKRWLWSNSTSVKNSYELLTHELGKCALTFMEGSLTKKLRLKFIRTTLTEYLTTPENEAACRIAKEMCSHALQLKNDLGVNDILKCIAPNDKVEQRNIGLVFVKVVSYICARVCCHTDSCSAYIAYLNQKSKQYQKVMIPINSILRLYAARLLLDGCKSTNFKLLVKILEENFEDLLRSPSVFIYKHDQHLHEAYQLPYLDALACLCFPIISSLLFELRQFMTEEYHLSTETLNIVRTMFDVIFKLVHSNPRYIESGDKIYKMDFVCNLALAAFALSIRTSIDFQRSRSTVKKIIAMEWFEKEKRYIVECLNQIAKISLEKGKNREASEALNLCCAALWVCIKCNMGNLSQAGLEKLVLETQENSAQLLNILRDMSHSKVKEKLIEYLTEWSTLFNQSENLPTPILVVKTWVEIECERTSKDKSVDSPTLYNLLDTKLSKRNIWSILQQELLTYVEVRGQYPTFCDKMIQKNKANLLEIASRLPNSCLQKSQIEEGQASRVVEIDNKTIQCLSEALWEAIVIMEENSVKMEAISLQEGPFNHQMGVAYCLHALCNLESDPYFEDIKQRIFGDVKTASAVFESIMYLLYNIFDLLQLKGFMESSRVVYEQLTRMHKLKSFSTLKRFSKMWESRRLSHPLCVLPVDITFIQKYLLDDSSKLEKIESYIQCFEENKAASLGFQQNFSFLLGNSPSDRDIIFQRNITVDEVHEAAHELISTEPVPSHSTFLAGNIFLDLCQRHIANGQLSKALSFAKEAQGLHGQLFNRKFAHNVPNQNEENNIKFDYSKIAMEIFQFDSISSDLGDTYLSPWKILQCYLESTLQVAIIFEKVGNGTEAEVHLLSGEKISRFLDLPLFRVAFSSLLGKIYAQRRLTLGETKLKLARMNMSDGRRCCSMCKLLNDATLDEYFGEMHESTSMEKTRKFYKGALAKLDRLKWKNSFGCPDIATEDSTCTCSAAVARSKRKRKRKKEGETGSSVRVTQDQCPYSRMKCWPSLPYKIVKSGSLSDLIDLKWEFLRRKLYMELLAKLVRNFAKSDELDKVNGYLLRSIWVMVDRNLFYHTNSPFPLQHFHHLIAKETPGDVFVVERAELMHNICWYCLSCYHHPSSNRNIFTNSSSTKFEDLASWLMQAFILSREVPRVLQKVSKLLAVMYIVSASREQYLLPVSKIPYWSAYFLQASMGTDLTCGFLSRLPGRHKDPNVSGSSCIKRDTLDLLRLPTTTADLEEHMKDFLDDLPSTTVVCISLLGCNYSTLLQELLLSHKSVVQAWILVSRLSAKREPIVMLLPVNSILPEYELGIDRDNFEKYWKQPIDDWCCPWGSTVVDDIAPAFKTILKENNWAGKPLVKETVEAWKLRDKWREILDKRLKRLLREIEDLWFGPWKFLLLGELVNCKIFDSVVKKIGKDLRSKFKSKVNEGLLEIILGGSKYVYDKETSVSNLCLKKECYIAKVGRCDEAMSWILSEAANESGELSKDDLQLLNEALNLLEVDDSTQRAPITLVLDYEVQMLPWESFPVLSNQEVYRMPSVSSVHAVLDKGSNPQEQLGQNLVPFPSIDPLNAHYLLNPSGDLLHMQNILEKYFTDRNLEGNAGPKTVPTMKKLAVILESHDLFLYIGHGNGEMYIPSSEILKLKKCAAAILIGCGSCSLTLRGCYAPEGTALSYLLAGAPFIVGHQWNVTSFDMAEFVKMLVYLMREEMSQKCLQCDLRGLSESDSPNNNNCCHQLKIGDIIVRARKVCKSFLNEASIVCYGIPTGIRKKNI